MSLVTCSTPSWGVLKKITHDSYNAAGMIEQIGQMLCLQFDIALAVKDGVRRELVQRTENDIREALHENIARMYGAESRKTRPSNCDVCGLIEIVKKMARSQYAKDSKRFMLATLDSPSERTGFNWSAAFDDYRKDARLPDGNGIALRVERAKDVMAELADIAMTFPHALVSDYHDDYDGPTIGEMVARTQRELAVLSRSHLTVVPSPVTHT